MNEMNPFDPYNNCQMKNSWPKWNPAQQNDNGIQVKREEGNFSYNNVYSYSPSYQEQTSYFEADRKSQIKKTLHPSCNIPGQLQMEQPYLYAGGNHQVPGSEDSFNFDSGANEFYTEMPKHTLPQMIHGGEEMYQGNYSNTSHPHIHPIPISEGSTSSLPVSITPYTLQTNASAPPSPSVAFDLESSQYIQSNSSTFHEPIMSPYSAGPYQQFSYEDAMSQDASSRGGKDPKYCERRRKNNEASKKSRAKKKEKAKEMESRAQILEQENQHLRQKYSELEQEVAVYKKLTETITSCDSQECSTPSCLALQRSEPVRANNAMP